VEFHSIPFLQKIYNRSKIITLVFNVVEFLFIFNKFGLLSTSVGNGAFGAGAASIFYQVPMPVPEPKSTLQQYTAWQHCSRLCGKKSLDFIN
jgi:hypothetical protein